jgi:hypothetical protein
MKRVPNPGGNCQESKPDTAGGRHRQLGDEPWKAQASEPKESVQARAVGTTAPGADRVGPTRYQAHCPRLEGLVPGLLNEILINSLIDQHVAEEF